MTGEESASTQAQCQNCRASLMGPYCHHCGQPAAPVVRSFGSLVVEFLQETISLDSRAMRTLVALLARPGFLTNAYLSGRRKRFVPPLRLFLFTSLVCIFVIWLLNVTGEREMVVGSGGLLTHNGELAPEQRQQALQRIDRAAERGKAALEAQIPGSGGEVVPDRKGPTIIVDGGALSLELPWLSEEDNRRLEARLEKSTAKIRNDPNDFANDVLENIPQTTLLLVPFFALLMKLLYPFAGRYYVEHLIHALYGHAFLFLAVLLLIGLDQGDTRLSAASSAPLQWLGHLLGLLEVLLQFWVPVYFLLSLRVVYGQSWRLTVWKGFCLGFCYLFLFLFALVSLLLVSILVS